VFQFHVVVNHKELRRRQFVEREYLNHARSAVVHELKRLMQVHRRSALADLRAYSSELALPGYGHEFRKPVRKKPGKIVSRRTVATSRISEKSNEPDHVVPTIP